MMSDKALVKHLQKELARLECELKTPGSICDHAPLLRKKDMQIEKVMTLYIYIGLRILFAILYSLT